MVDCLAVGLYYIDSRGEAPVAAPAAAGLSCTGLRMFEFEMVDGWYDAPVPFAASARRSKNDNGLPLSVTSSCLGDGSGCFYGSGRGY